MHQQNINKFLERRHSADIRTPPKPNKSPSATPKRPRSSPDLPSGREKRVFNKMGTSDDAWLKKMEDLFDRKIVKLATKEDIKDLKEELWRENETLKKEIKTLKVAVAERDRRIELLEMDVRKNHLILSGLTYGATDDLIAVASKFFREILGMASQIEIESARSFSTPKGKNLLVILRYLRDKWDILRKSPILKDTGYGISQDFPYTIRQRRSKLLRIRRELRKTYPRPGQVRTDVLIVKEVAYCWVDSVGLCLRNGGSAIHEIEGVDLSALIAKLLAEGREGDGAANASSPSD